MKIYRIWPSGNHIVFNPKNNSSENFFACSFDGSELKDWKPIHLSKRKYDEPMSDDLGEVSFVVGSTPLLTPKAFEVLYPYIKDFAQFWETTTDYGNMYLVNVININDCVNYDESEFVRFKSSGRIMRIDKFAFHKNKIKDIELFKIPDENKTYPFVTEGLKNIIEENGLNGFKFELLSEWEVVLK